MSARAKETNATTDAHGPTRSGTATAAADVRADATGRAGNAPAAVHTCHRCGHTWTARTGRTPKQCPACNSPNWNAAARTCACGICGHTWTARANHAPKQCPACNSPNWNRGALSVVNKDRPLAVFAQGNADVFAAVRAEYEKRHRERHKR